MSTLPPGVAPASIVYRSRGALLLYGEAEQVRAALPLLPRGLKVLAICAGGTLGLVDTPTRQSVPGTVIQLKGHLGRFRASAAGPDGALDLGLLSPNDSRLFDLVVDLYPTPLMDHEVPPLGYIRTRGSDDRLAERLERLSRWIGAVNKPRYFHFDERLCAYDRQGLRGCRRCLDTCPANAIHSEDSAIHIDPYLCQGCGTCTLICPSGAVSYARPEPRITLNAIAKALEPRLTASMATGPVLVLYAGAAEPELPEGTVAIRLTTVGSVGMELWISALALGASRVLILHAGLLPRTSARLLAEQVALARQLLKAVGEAPERVRIIRDTRDQDWQGLSNPWPPAALDGLSGAPGKRSRLTAALTHLVRHLPARQGAATLDPGAPFGTLNLDQTRCTLCQACVLLCPTGALRNRSAVLVFAEGSCVQCGLCVNACPEQALDAIPRFLPPANANLGETILKPASEQFRCVECGTPFAPRSLVEGSMAHVREHPMFQGDGLRLLQMCTDCRQKATLGIAH